MEVSPSFEIPDFDIRQALTRLLVCGGSSQLCTAARSGIPQRWSERSSQSGGPEVVVMDKLRSYGAAMKVVGNADRQETGRWVNNRAENSHLPFRRRERAMLRFRQMRCLQKFAAVHSSVHNHFNQERHFYSRDNFKINRSAALTEWRQLLSA